MKKVIILKNGVQFTPSQSEYYDKAPFIKRKEVIKELFRFEKQFCDLFDGLECEDILELDRILKVFLYTYNLFAPKKHEYRIKYIQEGGFEAIKVINDFEFADLVVCLDVEAEDDAVADEE